MGIRYYAYAFDADLVQQAIDDPRSLLAGDPLADAWGMEDHGPVSVASFVQRSPKRDLLYLDKAWSALQSLTRPMPDQPGAGASFRMFEGSVTMHTAGWDPWVRAILPEEVPSIRDDLRMMDRSRVRASMGRGRWGIPDDEEFEYVLEYLDRAKQFVEWLGADGRGMVYLIG